MFIVAVAYINFVMKNNDSEKDVELKLSLRSPNAWRIQKIVEKYNLYAVQKF